MLVFGLIVSMGGGGGGGGRKRKKEEGGEEKERIFRKRHRTGSAIKACNAHNQSKLCSTRARI